MDEPSQETPLEIDVASVQKLVSEGESMLLVDCREQNEYDLVHLDQAKLVPMSELEQRVGELDGHEKGRVVVYCHFGGRSLQVAAWLRQRGFVQAQSMSGGIDRWATEIDSSLARY